MAVVASLERLRDQKEGLRRPSPDAMLTPALLGSAAAWCSMPVARCCFFCTSTSSTAAPPTCHSRLHSHPLPSDFLPDSRLVIVGMDFIVHLFLQTPKQLSFVDSNLDLQFQVSRVTPHYCRLSSTTSFINLTVRSEHRKFLHVRQTYKISDEI